jgi:outer membrane protein TolC
MIIFRFTLIIVFFLSSKAQASLERYMSQVQESHSAYIGAIKRIKALDKRLEEVDLQFAPELFSNIEWRQDRGPRLNIAFQGDSAETTLMTLGVRKETRFGLNASLSYESFRERYEGRPTQFFPLNDYYTNSLVLNLEQSLLRNSFGKQSRLQEQERISQNYYQALLEEQKALEVLVNAQKAYWSLAINQELLKTLEESTRRAKSILDYNTKRYKRRVVEEDDVLQAKAGYLSTQLKLEETRDNLVQVQKDFDGFLENSSFNHPLSVLSSEDTLKLKAPDLTRKSLPYLTEQQNTKALESRNKSLIEGAKPELTLYGNLTTGDIQADFDDATDGAFSTNQPITTVGLRFSTPLAVGKIKTLFKGYTEEVAAAQVQLQRRIEDEQVAKDKQLKRFKDLQKRLRLSKDLEAAQKKKLEFEKRLQKNGRSTTFKVLQFEQDYLAAQESSLRLKLEIMKAHTDFYSFGRLKDFL